MSALPKAVQKQVAEANSIADRIKKGEPLDGSTPSSSQQPPAPPQPQPTPGESAQPAQPAQPASVTPAPGSPPQVTPPGQPLPEESWERRYRILQGKYNAEVPKLSQQVKDLQQMVSSLQSQLTTTQALLASLGQRGGSAPANPAGAAPAPTGKLVKDEEVKQFGPDLYDFIQRVARETVSPELAQLRPAAQRVNEVAQTVQQVAQRVAKSDEQKFAEYLDQHVPNWTELNEDEEFLLWLDQVDPYTGRTRQELLNEAAQRFDGPRVVAFFKGFQNEHAAVSQTAQPTPAAQQPAAPAATSAAPAGTPASLERLVAPGAPRAGAAGAPNEAQKRIWTAAEINEFEQRKRQYVIRGKKVPDELVQMEREIIAAGREGRVRP